PSRVRLNDPRFSGRGSPSRHRYPIGLLPASWLTPPRSGLERSDFVPWTFSTIRLMLFLDGRRASRARPVVGEYIRPNVNPRKSNSPSGTLQIRVFSSFTVSFSL